MKSLSLSQPHAILMVGIPGSGKSFFAEKFAETFNTPYVNTTFVQSLVGNEEIARTIANFQLNELFKTNQSIIFEGDTTDDKTDRLEMSRMLRKIGYEPVFVWVQTDLDTAKMRTLKLRKEINEDRFEAMAQRFIPPHASESPIVISGKHTYATQAKIVLKRLTTPRASISLHNIPPTRIVTDIRRSR